MAQNGKKWGARVEMVQNGKNVALSNLAPRLREIKQENLIIHPSFLMRLISGFKH